MTEKMDAKPATADNTEERYHSLSTLNAHQDLSAELGNMVVAWAFAENMLIHVMSRVSSLGLNMSQNGYYRIPTINSRMQFIIALIDDWETKVYDKLAILQEIEGLGKLSTTRNHWVHGNWCVGGTSKEVVTFDHRAKIGSSSRRKPVKAADVKNHNEAVLTRANALKKLVDANSLVA